MAKKNVKDNKVKEKLYRKNRKLELLNELILEISYKKDTDELLNTFLMKICKIIGADFGFIYELDKLKSTSDLVWKYKVPEGFVEDIRCFKGIENKLHRSLDDCNCNKELENNNIFIEEPESKSDKLVREIALKYNIKSMVAIPLSIGDKSLKGIIRLYSLDDRKIFYRHKSFLKAVGNVLSILFKEQIKVQEEQNKMVRNEKLNVLGEMAGGIAHDFNNVLTSIMGFSQMAMYSDDIDKIKRHLEVIYKSTLDGKAIVDKIQKFTKKKASKAKDLVNLNDIVTVALEMTRPIWKNEFECRNIKIDTRESLKSNSLIYCNEYEIRESLINIIINAIDAMPNGGNLTVKTYDNKDKCFIQITDTGIGMTEDETNKMFEPFYTTKQSRGTGLGLSIVKNIINEHNGIIKVESKIGKGTKFIIELNRHEQVSMSKIVENDLDKFPQYNALIIDDKKDVAESLGGMLDILNIKYDTLLDSESTLNKITKNNYDFILCDLAMPKLNGIDVSKIVKENNKESKFILITGWPGNIKKKELTHIDYVIEKPCTLEELSRVIKEVV